MFRKTFLQNFIFVFILVNLKLAESKRFQIVGGSPTLIDQFPFLGVYYSNNEFVCSCSLISRTYALSAAHCTFYYPWKISLRFGTSYRTSNDGVLVNVTNYIQHPDFNISNYNNDISILNFAKALRYSALVHPIKLPTQNDKNLKTGTNVKVAGWGMLTYDAIDLPSQLYSITVQISDFKSCAQNYSTQYQELTDNMICAAAYSKDACLGDSGGPLVFNNTLHGIVSFGYGCGMEFYPGVYTKVYAFLSWLHKNIPAITSY